MLVEGSHNSGADISSPRDCLAVLVIEGYGGQNASGADFQFDISSLVEDIVEDVFVIGDGADHLQDQLAVANNSSSTGTIISVLVLQTIVLFVHTNDVLQLQRVALRVVTVTIKIFDVA